MKMLMRVAALSLSLLVGNHAFAADAVQLVDVKPETVLERSAKKDSKLVILDVRTPEEFAQGHVPGAINISHDKLQDRIGELMGEKDKDIVLYCRSGRRTGLAAETLRANGFQKLFHMEGDMQQWTEAKRPTEK